jgi:ABC-2 type transport system ATP-binding protein
MIKVTDLEKSYGDHKVLKGLNAQFEGGKVYGIVGVNGSGKSTFFECLAGLIPFNGHIESSWNPVKNHIGLLVTNPYFLSLMTGREYIQLICNASNVGVPKDEAFNIFDLPLNQYASSYSTGMKKKLALTALLLQKNEVFILDEPFNGVDIQSNILITEIVKRLKEAGRTLLISSHIFSSLREICDVIYHLDNGVFTNVQPNGFDQLEQQMKKNTIGKVLDEITF